MSSNRPVIPFGVKLLLLFTVLPLVELLILIWLANATTFLFTLALVILSGILGAAMARREGMSVWMRAQKELQMGRFPADSLVDGLIILIGGALLVTPGIITDIAGFSTLIPPVRRVYRAYLKKSFQGRFRPMGAGVHQAGGFHVYTSGQGVPPPEQPAPAGNEEPSTETPFDDHSPFGRLRK